MSLHVLTNAAAVIRLFGCSVHRNLLCVRRIESAARRIRYRWRYQNSMRWCRKSGVVEYVKELKITESILVQFRDELNRAAMKQAEVSELACYARTIPRSYVGGRCSKH